MKYKAVITGLRRKEIRTLIWRNLTLENEVPTVTVEARYSKARRRDVVALPKALAEELKSKTRLTVS